MLIFYYLCIAFVAEQSLCDCKVNKIIGLKLTLSGKMLFLTLN